MTLTVGLLLALAALIIGYAKTAIGGLATISVAIFASVMPARESTAAILLLLIIGDVVAVWHYRRDADLSLLRRLIPAVLPGLALGAVFLAVVDDTVLRRSIGVLLLAMVALQLVMRWRSPDTTAVGESHTAAIGTGLGAGFATMTANAAGTVMTLCKVPFSAGLGLLSAQTLVRTAVLAPLVVLGAWAGLHSARRLSQARFDQAVLAATVVSALALVLR